MEVDRATASAPQAGTLGDKLGEAPGVSTSLSASLPTSSNIRNTDRQSRSPLLSESLDVLLVTRAI